ncbi:uncharacterized protein LOC122790871 isoform X2 [Protopterus annectens]|nr:uncharacterized protein LOC122790871 isoform X2 [Protopterus annectens]
MMLCTVILCALLLFAFVSAAPNNCTGNLDSNSADSVDIIKLYGQWHTLAIATNSTLKSSYFCKVDNAQVSLKQMEEENKVALSALARRNGTCFKKEATFTVSNRSNEILFEGAPNTLAHLITTITEKHFFLHEATRHGKQSSETLYFFGKDSSLSALSKVNFQRQLQCMNIINATTFYLPQMEAHCPESLILFM